MTTVAIFQRGLFCTSLWDGEAVVLQISVHIA